ncbi:MAG TPA: AI-2E family transporter [Polyangiaceae bacterium]|nr:AI-2E family transporter [Polyangiaceae bacterium]
MATSDDKISAATGPGVKSPENAALRWMVVLLSVAALFALGPLWAPLLLAAFAAVVAAPFHARLSKKLSGRKGSAAALTAGLLVLLLLPMVVVVFSVSASLLALPGQLHGSKGASDVWQRLSSSSGGMPELSPQSLLEFGKKHGAQALGAATSFFGALATAAVGLFLFVYGFHTFLVDGRRTYAWALRHSPIPRANLRRLGDAFSESARGLLIGVGLTALIQGVTATIGYVALGVPQPLVLGLITCVAALIPSVGTALIWAPVTLALFLTGRPVAAAIMLGIGAFVSVVDNFIRPALSKYGELSMSTFLLLVAMLGGITAFGPMGLLLGPLLVRLAIEAWEILHDEGLDAAGSPKRVLHARRPRALPFARGKTG